MTVLQASLLLCKTSLLSLPLRHRPLSLPPQFHPISRRFQSLSSNKLSPIRCTLHPDSVNTDPESISSENTSFSEPGTAEFDAKDGNFSEKEAKVEVFSGVSEAGLENGVAAVSSENLEIGEEGHNGNLVGKEGEKGRIGIMVFLVGLWAVLKRGLERVLVNDWFSWLPFWRQEKRLERLIAEADAEPKDAAKQSALLVELNKHRLDLYWCLK